MLNNTEINDLFNVKGKNYIDRAIITQTNTKFCRSFIRNKIMLRYSFSESIIIVRNETMHKIISENENLIERVLKELTDVCENIKLQNISYFENKTLSEVIPNYMLLINYIGIPSKDSKLCNRLRNYLVIISKFLTKKISSEHFEKESKIQFESLQRKLNYYSTCEQPDIIIYILRYDVKKRKNH